MADDADEDLCEVVITAPDEVWVRDFTHRLVDLGLVSAVHLSIIDSTYTWDGQLVEVVEARAALRTICRHVQPIFALVSEEHPYDIPSVVATRFMAVGTEYRQWVTSLLLDVVEPDDAQPKQHQISPGTA